MVEIGVSLEPWKKPSLRRCEQGFIHTDPHQVFACLGGLQTVLKQFTVFTEKNFQKIVAGLPGQICYIPCLEYNEKIYFDFVSTETSHSTKGSEKIHYHKDASENSWLIIAQLTRPMVVLWIHSFQSKENIEWIFPHTRCVHTSFHNGVTTPVNGLRSGWLGLFHHYWWSFNST